MEGFSSMEVVIEYGVLTLAMLSVPLAIIFLIKYFNSKNYNYIKALFLLLIFATTVFARLNYAEFWLADSCLDSGGSFNYPQLSCEH
jgi:hypothetical protein